jgi:protein-disulfide isomerase
MENTSHDDVIVLRKDWVKTTSIALACFVVGALVGYAAALLPYTQGLRAAEMAQAEQAAQARQAAPAPAAAAAQPTSLPARLDDVSADDDPATGSDDPEVVIVEFSDFQCPYCARFHQQTFPQLMENYGDRMQFVYRDFPLESIHPQALPAAEAAECADDQGAFWEYQDLLFANQGSLDSDSLISYAEDLQLDVDEFRECFESGKYEDEVRADLDDGMAYGVSGTPTFFINGMRLVGAQPYSAFEQVIEEELGN